MIFNIYDTHNDSTQLRSHAHYSRVYIQELIYYIYRWYASVLGRMMKADVNQCTGSQARRFGI